MAVTCHAPSRILLLRGTIQHMAQHISYSTSAGRAYRSNNSGRKCYNSSSYAEEGGRSKQDKVSLRIQPGNPAFPHRCVHRSTRCNMHVRRLAVFWKHIFTPVRKPTSARPTMPAWINGVAPRRGARVTQQHSLRGQRRISFSLIS